MTPTLYCFDVDGTLVRSFMREGKGEFTYADVEPLPNRLKVLQGLAGSMHSRFALVTNQGGVAFGYQTEQEVYAKMADVLAEFDLFWSRPFSVHICFNHPKAQIDQYRCDDPRRKPGPGMLIEAFAAHRVAHAHTVFIGDMESDKEAAVKAGVQFEWAEDFFA